MGGKAMSANVNCAEAADSGPGDPVIVDLVSRARTGDRQAWEALVDRYAPLAWAICRSYRLDRADAADVGQIIWLHLIEQLGGVRDPTALAGWLATTAGRECVRVLRGRGLKLAADVPAVGDIAGDYGGTAGEELLAAERHAALHDALSRLPSRCRRLISLLCADPPVPHAEISARLGIAVDDIGPYRSRCLDKLRRDPAIVALINSAPV